MGKVVTLGEVMLRLSTESGNRLAQSENLKVNYGGAEANVAISLANYGHEVLFASKVPKTVLGEAVQKHLQRYRVNTDYLLTGGARLGTYYLEAGSGERGSAVIYDRKGSSFAELEELEWNLTDLFNDAKPQQEKHWSKFYQRSIIALQAYWTRFICWELQRLRVKQKMKQLFIISV